MLRASRIFTNTKNISRFISTTNILKGKDYLPNEEWIERGKDYINSG